ncbi:uncharacterized protein LACBIDRAFT_313737 [Laccaria bicolor S238N-H82]|uniref:Predicted protein n=1 Tax=Laccaria bicolor (strain S238N-H82 / ATCC MYA-4686) TaxID=486041 RepID=B0D0Q1_LACBS|nr:uncharacterized protein LACBIDRAFT_313737 [Laccaria bicolor S238N-H82]EDR11860.1 predicted protein [Laccaria bicolor S238N-H82]|eukprot:XP_001877757.1 predicted protein [Laccaria bicolor S238N-H82]
MSSSSATAAGSRSPSPLTPEPSDSLDPVAIQSDLDLASSWYLSMHPTKSSLPPWESDPSLYLTPHKSEENQMLCLDELIEQHAYDDSPSPAFSSLNYSSTSHHSSASPDNSHSPPAVHTFRTGNLLVPSNNGPVSLTKPIPPPASLPRRQDPSNINQRVVHPPKESCYNLPIKFPSIPEGGTKSRVETQVRVTVDLADASSSSDPFKYDRVGSWKWLKLPPGTATKKRTRKQGKIDPEPQDILHLSTTITCSSPPHNQVLSCSSCQAREAKRVAKKLAARVRPARSESDSAERDSNSKFSKSKQYEDTTSIIQFNCAEVLDFSTGSVVLPLRITCYCRHHREKVGFNVHFTMMDHIGRIVGSGSSRPIMITDDHKTSSSANTRPGELISSFLGVENSEWSQVGVTSQDASMIDAAAPSRRKKDASSTSNGRKRLKPYDSLVKPNRVLREGSISSAPSPNTSYSPLPTTRSPTPSALHNIFSSDGGLSAHPPPLVYPGQSSDASSPDTLATPLDHNPDVLMPEASRPVPHAPPPHSLPLHIPPMMMSTQSHAMPYMFFDRNQQPMQMQIPTIHRLVPNMGPTHGGTEVTVLGANFHPSIQLNCIFGDAVASSTQRWSDNTLVCVLPPRAMPGVVAVWFDGFPKTDDQPNSPPSLFTYSDESDRALMELALQVVGLKMTGKIEDAKNVAMRIVGTAGSEGGDTQGDNSNMMQLASTVSSTRDLRPILFRQGGESDNFEKLIVDFLAILDTPMGSSAPESISTRDAISYASQSGQTLLHLSTLLGFSTLLRFLIGHGIDLDARDRNGFTALHFAGISQSKDCANILIEAGADAEIVNALGKTPKEVSVPGFFDDINPTIMLLDSDSDHYDDDEEADWGDAEEDADLQVHRGLLKRSSNRTLRRMAAPSGRATPRRSVNVSRAPTPPPTATMLDKVIRGDEKAKRASETVNDKQAASFMEKMIQKTLAQFPAPQGIIPNIPQLPLPHLPNLNGLPGMPWGALPQIPMVFPVFIPMMPGWPSFFGGENVAADGHKGEEDAGSLWEQVPLEQRKNGARLGRSGLHWL